MKCPPLSKCEILILESSEHTDDRIHFTEVIETVFLYFLKNVYNSFKLLFKLKLASVGIKLPCLTNETLQIELL